MCRIEGFPELKFKLKLELKRLNALFYLPKSLEIDVSARLEWHGIQLTIGDPFDIKVRVDSMTLVIGDSRDTPVWVDSTELALLALCRPIEELRAMGEQKRSIPTDLLPISLQAQDILALTKTPSWDTAEKEMPEGVEPCPFQRWTYGSNPPEGLYLDELNINATVFRLERGILFYQLTCRDEGGLWFRESRAMVLKEFFSRKGDAAGALYGPIPEPEVSE